MAVPRFVTGNWPRTRALGLWSGGGRRAEARGVRKWVLVAAATLAATAGLVAAARGFGPQTVWFAFVVVWLPMVWLGTISRLVTPRLPDAYHRLRAGERDGRIYELVGVRAAKWVLRRPPLAWFNPALHRPAEPTPERLQALDQRMRDAEASHMILLVATLAVVVHALWRGWWVAASATLVFDVLLNGYPVMLQRYNRARLSARDASYG